MKKIFAILVTAVGCLNTPASANSCGDTLPQITLQLTAKQWVTTHTAKVSISLEALLNKEQLSKVQDNFQLALKKIAPEGEWRITEFSRSPSKANLEQLQAVAEARLTDKAIAGLRERVNALSSEGQTYSVQNIVYSPTTEEVSAAQSILRQQIYNQTKAELDRLNAVYPKPGYTLYSINFVNANVIQPGPMMAKMNTMVSMAREATPALALSQQLTQDAMVAFVISSSVCLNSR